MSDPLARFLAGEVERGSFPGATWWVGRAGTAVSRGAVGAAEETTPFDLASLTKPLATASLLVLLEQDGRLDLDGDSPLAGRTLRELADHSAGLPAWAPLCAVADDLPGYLARIAELAERSPVEGTLYSDLGYILLGSVIEETAGTGLATLFRERIADRVGIERLAFAVGEDRFDDAAPTERGSRFEKRMAGAEGEGYAWRESIPPGQVHDSNAHALGGVAGHAGLFGTATDVARLGSALMRREPLGLEAPARERLLRETAAGGGRTVGMVLSTHSGAARGLLPDGSCGHTGFTGTSMWLDPQREACFVLLTNRIHPAVADADFQPVRREFHRLAARAAGGD
jgi:CubicO group peptidase (beta-lactamase class C family)